MRSVALALFLSLIPTSSAWALSCEFGPSEAVPAANSVDVPVNVLPRIRVAFGSEADWSVTLKTPEGAVVSGETRVESMGSDRFLTFVPDADLQPSSTYSVSASAPDVESSGFEAAFTTGEGRDEIAPASTEILSARRERSNGQWGPTDEVIVEVSGSDEPVLYQLEFDVDAGDDGFARQAPVYVLAGNADAYTLFAGQGLCRDTGVVPSLRGGAVFVTAIDLAGNLSEPVRLEGREVSSGCSTLSTAAPTGLAGTAVLLLGLVGFRRRRLG